jgi:hypothetical protein
MLNAQNSQALVSVPNQGVWNAGRLAEKAAAETPQQQLAQQPPALQYPPPGWQVQQPAQSWQQQQQQGTQQNQAQFPQAAGGQANVQQLGNGNGAPFQGQGIYQSQQQGSNGFGNRGQPNRPPATRCTRCGSPDHLAATCPSQQVKCFTCNGYGHRSSCNNPKSPSPYQVRRPTTQNAPNQNAMTGTNTVQPAFQQMQAPKSLTMPQPITQQPFIQTHPGIQCQNCGNVGHISGTCPNRR